MLNFNASALVQGIVIEHAMELLFGIIGIIISFIFAEPIWRFLMKVNGERTAKTMVRGAVSERQYLQAVAFRI